MMIDKWRHFADLTCDPVWLGKLRRAVGLLALLEVIGWILACTILGYLYR